MSTSTTQTAVDLFFTPKTESLARAVERELSLRFTRWGKLKNQFLYSFTIAPHAQSELKATLKEAVSKLRCTKTFVKATYIYEVSELGKHHIHGILVTRNKTKFTKSIHPKTYMDFSEDPSIAWIKYILKDEPTKLHFLNK